MLRVNAIRSVLLSGAAVLTCAAAITTFHQIDTARQDWDRTRSLQEREVRKSLTNLYRDIETVNMLVASANGNTQAPPVDAYLTARRGEMSAVSWLGYAPDPQGNFQALLSSAAASNFGPRRDGEIEKILGSVHQTGLIAAIPETMHDLGMVALALPSPNSSSTPGATIVALVDMRDLIRDAVQQVYPQTHSVQLRLDGRIIASNPPEGNIPDVEDWQLTPIWIGNQSFELALAAPDWWILGRSTLVTPLLLLGMAAVFAYFGLSGRFQGRQDIIPALPPAQPPNVQETATAATSRLWQLGEISASLAHDLGQPLNIIRLNAENALDSLHGGRLEPARLEKALRTTIDQGNRAQGMMDALIAATRRPSTPPELFSPIAVMRGALAVIQPRIRDQKIRFSWHGQRPCPQISGHPARLRAALTHLLINACEALATGGLHQDGDIPTPRLTVTCRAQDDQVIYMIADNGPGFPQEMRDGLTKFIASSQPSGKGCGLGLPVALGVIAEMGGSITLTDAQPGSILEIHLPAATTLPALRNVLLVDDEPDAVTIMGEYLAARGWTVRTAHGGNEALAVFQQHPCDVVVTDLRMGDGDGWTLIERLTTLAPHVPVIVVSTSQGRDAARAIGAGALMVLNKPVALQELVEEIENSVEGGVT